MFTSAMNKRRRGPRNIIGLLTAAAACVVITNVYALFGHGVRSEAMDFMFLYPLGGAAVMALMCRGFKRRLTRLGANLLNSGVATLTAGAMLQGILEIAGGSSGYVPVFGVVGWGLAAGGMIAFRVSIHFIRASSRS